MKRKLVVLFMIIFSIPAFAQQKTLLIRCDDMGMSHSVNMAFEKLFKTGLPVSASVMFGCPWYKEAVDILKKYDNVAIGVHLTLNSEWKNYKWGPVSGRSAVPSLVDEEGYFYPTRKMFFDNEPSTEEVEKELRAQVERAFNTGLPIAYLDYHMGTAMDKPEYRDIVEKLADEFKVGISRFFKEDYANNMYSDPYESKEDSLIFILLNTLSADKINLLVCHIGIDDSELGAMEDLNVNGLKELGKHRNAELNALLSDRAKEIYKDLHLINYKELKDQDRVRPPEFVY